MEKQISIKQQLYSECVNYVETKIEQITTAVNELQQASKLETKSSMGDKYEIGRASIQLEMEKYAQQLTEFTHLEKNLFQINANKQYDSVQPGCLVCTNNGNYFIAITAGEFEIEGVKYLTISLASPLGKEL
ncbi:MAG: 3-oxoacyl-ACP synthase, partial [Ignavibacteria bacterium]|nr:3-oxoacyl-ACP synthase [Ignavibacteria bacterium]